MTYVVNGLCLGCKYMDCVTVCPVDCFHEGPNMLVIDPEVCIDCGVCEAECPVAAIIPDTQPGVGALVTFNREHAKKWPVITQVGVVPDDAEQWRDKNEHEKWEHFYPEAIITVSPQKKLVE